VAVDLFEPVRFEPVRFVRDELGLELWSKQREVIEAVRDHDRVAVRSAHATGKTAVAAAAVMWWLAGYPGSVAVTTAPTERQVKKLLWREIARRYRYARTNAKGSGRFDKAKLTDLELSLGDDWYAVGLTADNDVDFQGWHSPRILVVVDEASGVDEQIFEAIEGVLAGGVAKLVLIGNPTRLSGQFFRAFNSERPLWKTISISAFDAPALTGEPVSEAAARGLVRRAWVEDKVVKWGEDSPLFAVRVLGEFPSSSTDDTVIALADVEAAQARRLALPEAPCAVVSCDCARYGSDSTVISTLVGSRVRIVKSYVGKNLMQTAGECARVARELAREYRLADRPRIVVDDAGLGGGVVDRLRELGEFPVVAFLGAGAARDPAEYPNRRSEAWFQFADRLGGLDLDPRDDQLVADLVAPCYSVDSAGRRVVEAKAVTKKRLGRSPDRADSVLMAVATPAAVDWSGYRHVPSKFELELARAFGDSGRALEEGLTDDLLWRPM
jgi:hypothetical protein